MYEEGSETIHRNFLLIFFLFRRNVLAVLQTLKFFNFYLGIFHVQAFISYVVEVYSVDSNISLLMEAICDVMAVASIVVLLCVCVFLVFPYYGSQIIEVVVKLSLSILFPNII